MTSLPAHPTDRYPSELLPEHAAYLAARSVLPAEAQARGYRSLLAGDKKKLGVESAHHYGFSSKWGGLLIPLCPLSDVDAAAYQIRYFSANIGKPGGPPRKFLTPRGQRNRLASAPAMHDHLQAGRDYVHGLGHGYIIAEGVTRVDALAGLGISAVGIMGIDAWLGNDEHEGLTGRPLADWRYIGKPARGEPPLPFIIIPDGDVLQNEAVNASVRELARFLVKSKGGADPVRVLVIPPVNGDEKAGLDDWIAALRRTGRDRDEILAELSNAVLTVNELPRPIELHAQAVRRAAAEADAEARANPTVNEVQAHVDTLLAPRG